MKSYIICIPLALLLLSCGGRTPDPVEEAIKTEIMTNMNQQFKDVKITSVEKIDSTTFRTELDRRKKVFTTKRDVDSEGKKRNAALKNESYRKDLAILSGLDSIGTVHSDILDDVAYYDYRFSAEAKGQDMTMLFKDAYISVTPDGRVISMTAERRDLHKSTGRVIPGYFELVSGADEEEEQDGSL